MEPPGEKDEEDDDEDMASGAGAEVAQTRGLGGRKRMTRVLRQHGIVQGSNGLGTGVRWRPEESLEAGRRSTPQGPPPARRAAGLDARPNGGRFGDDFRCRPFARKDHQRGGPFAVPRCLRTAWTLGGRQKASGRPPRPFAVARRGARAAPHCDGRHFAGRRRGVI